MRRLPRGQKLDDRVEFIGGPMNGQLAERQPRQTRWSIYRDDDGAYLKVVVGDKEWLRSQPASKYYTRQVVWKTAGSTSMRHTVYVHATAWGRWQEERSQL